MESISPIALRKVTRELYALENDPPEGIRLILNEDAMTDIQAWIQGPEGTPYEGGCFRLRIQLGTDFPNSAPKCFFLTKIFHPNVSNKGDVCVSTLKKDWKKDLGIRHILLVVKCLLIVPNPESALNEEAGRQLLERYDDYAKHARLMTSIHAQPAGQDLFTTLPPPPTTTQPTPSAHTASSSSSSSSHSSYSTDTAASAAMDEEMTITSVYNENQSKTAAARIVIPRVLGSTDVSASEPTNTLARIHKDDQALPLICVDDTNDSISSTSMSTTKAALSLQEALLMTSTSTSTTASSPLCPKRKVGQDEKPVDQIMCSTSTASHSRQPLSGQPTRQTLQGLPTHRNQTPVWSSHPYKQASGHIRHEWPKDKAHESPIRSNIGTTAPKNMRGSMESRKRTLRRL